MSQKTPLYEEAQAAGAIFEERNGWLLPAHFGQVIADHQTACSAAALFDISHHGKVKVTGADAGRFLHNLCTNEISNLASGSGCEAFLTTGQAKIVAYAIIYRACLPDQTEAFFLDVGAGMGEAVLKHLDRYLISEQVELADETLELAELHLAGPRARGVLESASLAKLPALSPLQHIYHAIGGATCHIRGHEPLGLAGFDILCPRVNAPAVWKALLEAGAKPAGSTAYEILRVEAGTPVYGSDIDETNLPQEVGRIERTVSFTKGCYIGQETIARIRTYGHVNRSLVGLKLSGCGAVKDGAKVLRDGKEVGQITSSVQSPRVGQPIALAYLRRGNHEPGTKLEVAADDERRSAEVVPLPFVGAGAGPV